MPVSFEVVVGALNSPRGGDEEESRTAEELVDQMQLLFAGQPFRPVRPGVLGPYVTVFSSRNGVPHDEAPPNAHFIDVEVLGPTLTAVHYLGQDWHQLSIAEAAQIVVEILETLADSAPPSPLDAVWLRSSEELITRLERLLAQRNELLAELARTYGDLHLAEARIKFLEGQLLALQSERSSGKPDRTLLVLVATAVFTLLGPLIGSLTDAALATDAEQTVVVAQQVQVDCGSPISIHPGGAEVPDDEHLDSTAPGRTYPRAYPTAPPGAG